MAICFRLGRLDFSTLSLFKHITKTTWLSDKMEFLRLLLLTDRAHTE